MIKIAVLILGSCLSAKAYAQQLILPPSSLSIGAPVNTAGMNNTDDRWNSGTSLGAYRVAGDGFQDPLVAGSPDNHLGLDWNAAPSVNLTANQKQLSTAGGFMRVIFVGESAGWLNDFGFTYSGNPVGPGTYTIWSQIQSVGPAKNMQYGDYVDIPIAPGNKDFDLWFSATGKFGSRPTAPTELGGIYTAFNPSNSSVYTPQYLWAASAIAVDTWIPAESKPVFVPTFLASIEDWRIDRGSDQDYSDFRFALQFLDSNGEPLAVIPEPSSWALVAGSLAFGFVFIRKFYLGSRRLLYGPSQNSQPYTRGRSTC
jgi:hypothetical protein